MPDRPFDPAARGFHVVYRAGEKNHCPGCGRTQWLVGRVTAECAFCSTAIMLEQSRITIPSGPCDFPPAGGSGQDGGRKAVNRGGEGRVADLPPDSGPPCSDERKN